MIKTEPESIGRVKMFENEGRISKNVGWFPRQVSWPYDTRELEAASDEQLLEWYRFLPSAENEVQRAMISRIIEKLFSEGRQS